MSASRVTRLLRRRPVIASSIVLAAGAATTYYFAYAQSSRKTQQQLLPYQPHQPITLLQRDAFGHITPPMFPTQKSRLEHLADLRAHSSTTGRAASGDPYDLLIIGGGATGSGIALDAASRGLRVALVERDDFSSGASSKSTKLVHGGVRYLEKAFWNLDYEQFKLVREALRERKTFLDVAPHLTSSLPILLPVYSWWQLPYFWAGTKAYELLASLQGMGLQASYALGRRGSLEAFPLLKKEGLVGSLVYFDGQQNDSRVNVALALTAAAYGATVANHVEVVGLEKDGSGKLCGARIRDALRSGSHPAGDEFVVYAKGVVNATGPFADAIEKMDDPARRDMVSPSSGVHVVLPGNLCVANMGVLEPATSDGRVIFFLPWEGKTIAGTTDAPCAVESEPVPREAEINFILKEVQGFLCPSVKINRDDVLAAWSGIRPLVRDPRAKNTESLVRNHLVTVSDSGLLTCAGGKWTTYRQMAEDAVDEAIRVFGLTPILPNEKPLSVPPGSQTRQIPLLGAHGFSTELPSQLTSHFGLPTDIATHLAASYGDRAWEVARLHASSPSSLSSSQLAVNHEAARLAPGFPFVAAEIAYSARHEMAETAADLLARRMRLAFLDARAALVALPRVVDTLGAELGWDAARRAHEWRDAVRFLASMGLAPELAGVTREQVLGGDVLGLGGDVRKPAAVTDIAIAGVEDEGVVPEGVIAP